MNSRAHSSGLTLIELMIVVAIIAIISGLAIPAYNNYIREAHFGATRMNAEPLRLVLEDYRLDNGGYGLGGTFPGGSSCNDSQTLDTRYGWCPEGDGDAYDYSVTVNGASYTITVTDEQGYRASCVKDVCTYSKI